MQVSRFSPSLRTSRSNSVAVAGTGSVGLPQSGLPRLRGIGREKHSFWHATDIILSLLSYPRWSDPLRRVVKHVPDSGTPEQFFCCLRQRNGIPVLGSASVLYRTALQLQMALLA